MKSRATICLLLAAVVGVWGLVAWRLLAPAKRSATPERPKAAAQPPAVAVVEALRLDYPDPFLKGAAATKTTPRPVVRALPSKAPQKPRERVAIAHLATISSGGRALHVVTLGREQYELREGDTVAGFLLRSVDRDSLYFRKDGMTYSVARCRQ